MNDSDRPTKYGDLNVGDTYWGGNTYCKVLKVEHLPSRLAIRITRRVLLPGRAEHDCPVLTYTKPVLNSTWLKTD